MPKFSSKKAPVASSAKSSTESPVEKWMNRGRAALRRQNFAQTRQHLQRAFRIRRGKPFSRQMMQTEYKSYFSAARLWHDWEQVKYLISKNKLRKTDLKNMNGYRHLLKLLEEEGRPNKLFLMTPEIAETLDPFYNRARHVYWPKAVRGGALNPKLDYKKIEKEYFSGRIPLAVVDDFLVPEALKRLRRFCLESTIWYDVRPGGYLGAYVNDGFCCELLFQIAAEFKRKLPRIFKKEPLTELWSYKYDQRIHGIRLHADRAVINVNFWITPDSANRNPNSGGMIVYDVKTPSHWTPLDYNSRPAEIRKLIESRPHHAEKVPYRANRVVLFDSSLFHETDRIEFEPGYENRRVNITLLYGFGVQVSKKDLI